MDSKLTSQNRWDVMESLTGTYAQNQVQNDMVEIRFNRPVAIKEHSRYAIRLCSQGSKTCFGDSGVSSLRGPCGVTFSFYPCDLSFNGTTPNRGQLPCILYYSSPRRKDGQNSKIIGEIHARDIALQIAREISEQSIEILKHVREVIECGFVFGKVYQHSNMHCMDSEHNITPIEEHLDVSCSNKPEMLAESSSMSLATRELTKKFESFTKNIVETLKAKTNPFDLEIATDVVGQETAPEEEPNRNFYHQSHPPLVDAEDEDVDDDDDNDGAGESSHMNTNQLMDIFNHGESAMFHTLMPAVTALIGPLVNGDPKSTVQILSLIRQILPQVAALNQQQIMSGLSVTPSSSRNEEFGEDDLLNENHPENTQNISKQVAPEKAGRSSGPTTSHHYCIVESEHPYRSASILTCRIEFPPCVQWFTIEFDSQCGTIQPDDYLNVSIPVASMIRDNTMQPNTGRCHLDSHERQVESVLSICSLADDNVESVHKHNRDSDSEDWIVVKKFNR